MSKFKVAVATLVALAMAAPAMAFDVKWGGDFNNRFMHSTQADVATTLSGEGFATDYTNNAANWAGALPNFAQSDEDSDFLGEIKYRLFVNANSDDKKVAGHIAFEFGGLEFGDNDQLDFNGDKRDNLELRHAWVDFEVPFDPAARVSIGLQPVGYNKFLWNDNAAGVKYAAKRGSFGYSLGWFRDDVSNQGQGTSTKLSNDDAYTFDIDYAFDNGPKLNAFVIYLEEGQESSAVVDGMDQQLWYGLAASGQAGNLFYGATFIKEDGEIDTGASNLDRDAFLANLEGTLKVDRAKIKLGWLYSTGDDNATDGDAENFSNIDAYMGGFGSVVVFDSFADDNTMVTAPYILDKGLNMIYAGADYDLTDKASIGASYLWINAAEDMDFGGAVPKGDKDLGNEISVRGSYKITKNLTAGIAAGYLIVGDALDEYNKVAHGESADDIIRTDASFRLKF